MSAETNTADSKLGGNTLDVIFSTMTTNEVQQMGMMNLGSHQLEMSNKGLSTLSNAIANLDTDTSGFSLGEKIAVGVGMALILVGGLALSCLIGPEAEAAAVGVDAAIGGAEAAAVGAEAVATGAEVVEGAGEAIEMVDFAADGASAAGDAVDLSDTVFDAAESVEDTRSTVQKARDFIVDGASSAKDKVKGARDAVSNKLKPITDGLGSVFQSPKWIKGAVIADGVVGVVQTIGNSTKSKQQTADLQQSQGLISSLEQQLTNIIGIINSQMISAPQNTMQGEQSAIKGAISAMGQIFQFPPVGA